MAIFKAHLNMGWVGGDYNEEIEIPDDELELCATIAEVDELKQSYLDSWVVEHIYSSLEGVD